MKRPLVNSFKPHKQGLAKVFGSLEATIIELLWDREPASARDIFEALRDEGQRLSYGATKTVMDRLVEKHIFAREMHNNQYLYTAVLTRNTFNEMAVSEVLDSLVASFGSSVVAHFLNHLSGVDQDELDQLQQMIDQARQNQ